MQIIGTVLEEQITATHAHDNPSVDLTSIGQEVLLHHHSQTGWDWMDL
jgi:hypothetical protein